MKRSKLDEARIAFARGARLSGAAAASPTPSIRVLFRQPQKVASLIPAFRQIDLAESRISLGLPQDAWSASAAVLKLS